MSAALGILVTSLIGSVHCAAMCGGFVCFYAGSGDAGNSIASLRSHAMYNVGRLASYLLLGGLAGALGAGLSNAGQMAGVAHAATVIAGALMVGWAVSTIAAQRGVAIGTLHAPEAWQRALGRLLQSIRTQPMPARAALTGLLTTLLPCGWLYVFVAMAGGTGSVRGGLTVMLIFWAGTVPAMLAVGIGAQSLFGPLRKRLPSLSAFAVLVMGVLAISGHLSMRDDQRTHRMSMSNATPSKVHEAMSHGR